MEQEKKANEFVKKLSHMFDGVGGEMLIFAGVLGASLLAFKVFKLADRFDVFRKRRDIHI